MIKNIALFVVLLVVGLIVITNVILPQVSVVLDRPDLDTWIGLEGFLKLLPFALVAGLLAGGLFSIWRRSKQ